MIEKFQFIDFSVNLLLFWKFIDLDKTSDFKSNSKYTRPVSMDFVLDFFAGDFEQIHSAEIL